MADGLFLDGDLSIYEQALARLDSVKSAPSAMAIDRADGGLLLAGIIPFYRCAEKEIVFCFMRPEAKHPHLPPPGLQICKGTRLLRETEGWRDVRLEDLPLCIDRAESLAVNALREGEEEIGLPINHLLAMWDMGPHAFRAQSGKMKEMALFCVEVEEPERFISPDSVRAATAEIRWLTEAEALMEVQPEHAVLLPSIFEALQRAL